MRGIAALLCLALPWRSASEISAVGVQNVYYQAHGYFGSRVLEHNETGRFERYVEATWTQHSVVDKSRRVWVVDRAYHQVIMIEPGSRYVPWHSYYTDYAGVRGVPGHFDGARSQSRFNGPMGIALCEPKDKSLVLFVSDTNNHVIRRLDFAIGRVSTIAGSARSPGLLDGSSSRARFHSPMSLGVDAEGESLFVLDNGRRIRHVSLKGKVAVVTTLVDGACRAVSRFSGPGSVVLRTVGCHPDWLAKDTADPDVEEYQFEVMCLGHQATCGPRRHPGLSDAMSPILRPHPSASTAADLSRQPSAAGDVARV